MFTRDSRGLDYVDQRYYTNECGGGIDTTSAGGMQTENSGSVNQSQPATGNDGNLGLIDPKRLPGFMQALEAWRSERWHCQTVRSTVEFTQSPEPCPDGSYDRHLNLLPIPHGFVEAWELDAAIAGVDALNPSHTALVGGSGG